MYVPTLAAIDSLEEGLERVGERKMQRSWRIQRRGWRCWVSMNIIEGREIADGQLDPAHSPVTACVIADWACLL